MELGNTLFFWCGELKFARQREKKIGVFFAFFGGVFAFFGGDFAFFGGDFALLGVFSRCRAIISRAARFFF